MSPDWIGLGIAYLAGIVAFTLVYFVATFLDRSNK